MKITCNYCGYYVRESRIRFYWYKFLAWVLREDFNAVCPWCLDKDDDVWDTFK